MREIQLPLIVFTVGVSLVVLSFFWPSIGASATGWTEEDAQSFEDIKLKRHRLHYKTSGGGGEVIHGVTSVAGDELVEARREYEEVDREYNRLQERLENAKDRPQAWATIFKWGGITLTVVGVVMLASQRGEA